MNDAAPASAQTAAKGTYSQEVDTARGYYNSEDADLFYAEVWGGEDIHIGLYSSMTESIRTASARSVSHMFSLLSPTLSSSSRILDLGSGYGGSARALANRFGCQITCLNLSEVENARNREMNERQGLGGRIQVVDGSFERLPFEDGSFDIVWTMDALLHSGERSKALSEIARVIRKPGGIFIGTDPVASDGAVLQDLAPILNRLHLTTLGTPGWYKGELEKLGARVTFEDHTDQLVTHYTRVSEELSAREPSLRGRISPNYIASMKEGLEHWVEGGKKGNLAWGIILARW